MLSDMPFCFKDNAIMPYFIKYFKNCDTFDNVQYILHTKKSKLLRSYHLLLICQYATWTCSAPDNNLNSVKFDWNSVLRIDGL